MHNPSIQLHQKGFITILSTFAFKFREREFA